MSKNSFRSERRERRAIRRRNQRLAIAGIALVLVALLGYLAWTGYQRGLDAQETPASGQVAPAGEEVTTASGLRYTDVVVGTGPDAQPGSTVSVHYTGTLEDGTKFDSSLDRNQPYQFVLGSGNVIQGWDEGVVGMKVGGQRQLIIPPDLAYGPDDYGPIPGNSTLYFDIELLDVQ